MKMVYERMIKDLERVNKLIEKVKDYIDFAKEIGLDTSQYEEELETLIERRDRIIEALKSRGYKIEISE